MKINYILITMFFLALGTKELISQPVILKAYTYESGNRGFLNQVKVLIFDTETEEKITEGFSDPDGQIKLDLPADKTLKLLAKKNLFKTVEIEIDTRKWEGDRMIFQKIEMKRAPGYLFEITLAEKRESKKEPVNAIKGALIEVYNNTNKTEVLNLPNHPDPEFEVNLLKNNHYTILVRKEGYLAKRMEAFVNVEGCILCFEGVGTVEPGVSDNLTEGHQIGTLLANVELEPLFKGKKIELQNIYYDYNKWEIRPDAKIELNKVAQFLKDNPRLNVELGSHTDSRGKTNYNLNLSKNRAREAVNYLIYQGGIKKKRITSKGYGESQLVNHCKDDVECSEDEHATNRRTELKVLGIDEPGTRKSLVEMKKEDDLEKLIIELSNQKVVKLEAGQEIPEDLKEIAEVNEETDKNLTTKKSESIDSLEISEDSQIDQLSETRIDNQNLYGEYTGFKIAAVITSDELSRAHKIFNQFEDVSIYKEKGMYYYLIGDFNRRMAAYDYLSKIIKMEYSKARLLGFQEGKRIE